MYKQNSRHGKKKCNKLDFERKNCEWQAGSQVENVYARADKQTGL